ncbi:acetyltransferase [Paenibacillus sp. N1-5-1-14]|uniref:acyltransferase n=1 Tax=Paenibacillus radicibacter TaxID=2972488 RepID=UPI0021594B89|nr:acyltransferase [Paenibacillus radicibacter]MCR8642512.1 acetyltransferase [Paenibacillus radicibacter]
MQETGNMGKYVIIEDDVRLGIDVRIGNHVIIYAGSIIGDHTVIQDHAVIGKQPTRARNSALPTTVKPLDPVVIGSGCTIGTSSIIYAGAVLGSDVYVADLATIRERTVIGEQTIVGRGVAIENDCVIGRACKLETNSYITAYSELGNQVFIAPCVVTTNDNNLARGMDPAAKFIGVTVRHGGRIGANATILPGKVIEEEGVAGAGSVVTHNIPAREVYLGSPARRLRDVPEHQLLDQP